MLFLGSPFTFFLPTSPDLISLIEDFPQEHGNIFPPVMDSNRRTAYELDRSGEFYAEVSLIILDCLEMMAEVFSGTKDEKILLEMVFKTLLEALGKNQSTSVLDCIFYTQRSFVRKFPHLFYDDESDLCKDLSLRLLCHCSSILGRVRAQASLSLYLLLRESYQTVQKFSWVKLQLTVALSNLVDTSTEIREDKFHESLKNVVKYAEADNLQKETQFPSQHSDSFNVEDVVKISRPFKLLRREDGNSGDFWMKFI
ncbi:hypothetical protein J437_LFUL019325 [Ladona fulva]|uniref:Uncharacterized protein n=1 Tax=Ladona fulva TaxID=123851 RepID=A0A8K0KQI2_LADFU|nr:hypothetical protein J437_LFUL019325 [Ladona fulva]